MITHKTLVAGAVGCAIAVAPGTSHALSCATNWAQVPRDRERDVPTNTLIWAHGRIGGASAARLIGPGGEVAVEERFIPVAISPGRGTHYPVLVPQTELEPNTRYAIEITYDHEEPSADVTERVRFTTGSGPATTAPPVPGLVSIEQGAGSGWLGGNQRWLSLGFDLLGGGILVADTAAALGSVASVDDLFAAGASFTGVDVTPTTRVVRWLSVEDTVAVGEGDCLIWPEDGADRQSARFGVLDLAGNFSGWTTAELELPSPVEVQAIMAAKRAEEEAHAAEVAELIERQDRERGGMFENHHCSFAPAGGRAAGHLSGLTAALGAIGGAALLRRRAVSPRRPLPPASR
jgi:hypothetical protein